MNCHVSWPLFVGTFIAYQKRRFPRVCSGLHRTALLSNQAGMFNVGALSVCFTYLEAAVRRGPAAVLFQNNLFHSGPAIVTPRHVLPAIVPAQRNQPA